jgi:hypothetical protein
MTAMFFTKQLAAFNCTHSDLLTYGGCMLINTCDARIQLLHGEHLRLRSAAGARLTSIDGIAWITVDRDPGDFVIPAGDSFVVPSDWPVLVGPLFGAATVEVQGTPRTVADAVARTIEPRGHGVPARIYLGRNSLSY